MLKCSSSSTMPPPPPPHPPSKKNWNGVTLKRCCKPSISPFYLLSVLYACFLDTLTCFLMLTVVPRKRGGSVLVATQTSLIFLDLKVRILSSFTFRKSPHFSHRSREWKNPWQKSGSQGLNLQLSVWEWQMVTWPEMMGPCSFWIM